MWSATRRLARTMLQRSGYVPNLRNLDLRPGAVLSVNGGAYHVQGMLHDRVRDDGDDALADALEQAFERVRPGAADGDTERHALGLKYTSAGTSLTAADLDVGGGTGLPDLPVDVRAKVKAVVQFGRAQDFLFDTTVPVPWYTLAADDMHLVNKAALQYLDRGELIVLGVAWARSWLWYCSRSANGTLGFDVRADASGQIPAVDLGNLADLVAGGALKLTWTRGEILDGKGHNSVAAFTCAVKKKPWFSDPTIAPLEQPEAFIELDGEPVLAERLGDALMLPDADDLEALVGPDALD